MVITYDILVSPKLLREIADELEEEAKERGIKMWGQRLPKRTLESKNDIFVNLVMDNDSAQEFMK